MVYVDRTLHFSIFVDHLIFIGYAADTISPFPPKCQLGGTFGRGGEGEDEAADLVGVSGWRGRRRGHLLAIESEPLLYGFDVCGGVFGSRGRPGIRGEVWRERWFTACCNHVSRESVGLMRHRVEGQHDSRYFINPRFGRRSLKQAGVEHVVEGLMAPFIDGVAFMMVGGSENLLDPKGAQQLGPDSADKLLAAVGEEPTRSAEVRDHVAHEGSADCVGGVVAGGDEDSIFGIAIQKNDQEFMAVVRMQWSHNVNGQRIPGALRLDSAGRFLAMAVVSAELTLGIALSGF